MIRDIWPVLPPPPGTPVWTLLSFLETPTRQSHTNYSHKSHILAHTWSK